MRLPGAGPLFQVTQLDAQDGGLQRVQPTICSQDFVLIFFAAAMNAEELETVRQGRVGSGDQAAIAGATQIFGREEAETSKITDVADIRAVKLCADGLRSVLDDEQSVFLRDLADLGEIGGETKEMNGHDGPRFGRDCRGNFGGTEIEGDGVYINEDRFCSDAGDGPRGSDEGERCGDH